MCCESAVIIQTFACYCKFKKALTRNKLNLSPQSVYNERFSVYADMLRHTAGNYNN